MSLETMKELPLLVVAVDMNSYIAQHFEPMQELSNMISFSPQVQDNLMKKTRELFWSTQGMVWNQALFWCLMGFQGNLW